MRSFLGAAACVLTTLPCGAPGLKVSALGEPDPPDFLACDLKEPCGQLESYFVADLLATVAKRAAAVTASGRTPLILHIGADGLRNGAMWTDVHLYKEVISDFENTTRRHAKLERKLNLYRTVVSQVRNVNMVFVEPVESKATDFWNNVKKLPIDAHRVKLETAVADGQCEQPFRTMYKFDNSLIARDLEPWDSRVTDGWTSLENGWIWNPVRTWLANDWHLPCRQGSGKLECKDELRKLQAMPNRTSYVKEIKVPCVTVRSLAERADAQLEDIVMLNIDTEGHDSIILAPVASDPDFKPAFLMWEGGLGEAKNGELAHQFRSRGYLVGKKPGMEGHGGDTPNIVAVPRGVPAPPLALQRPS